jgi:hypothetical protein
MDIKEFLLNYRQAFGSKASLPLLFGYKYKKTPEMVVWAHHRLGKFKRQELAENQGEEL